MNRKPYPTDLTAEQWKLLETILPPSEMQGRKREVDVQEIMNAILYLLVVCQSSSSVSRRGAYIMKYHQAEPESSAFPRIPTRRRAPRAREDCEAACYDCLMSYANQPDHQLLDSVEAPTVSGAIAVG